MKFEDKECGWKPDMEEAKDGEYGGFPTPPYEYNEEDGIAGWTEVEDEIIRSHLKEVGRVVIIKDNREMFRNKENTGQTCRVCGSSDVHTMSYNVPTMDCVSYLRECLANSEEALSDQIRLMAEADLEESWREYEKN